MKTRTDKWLWITAAALILTGTALLYAQSQPQDRGGRGFGKGPGMMGHGFMGFMARNLQLTDAQKTQIRALWDAEKPTIQPLAQQLANGRKQMLAITANGAFDQAKVAAIANQQSQTLAQLIVEKEKLQSQVYNQVLTTEQRAKVDALRADRTSRIDQWLQHMEGVPIE